MSATRTTVAQAGPDGAQPRPHRLAMLDGLRASSIALVLLSHLRGTEHFPPLTHLPHYVGELGLLGVRVFFVISGFLITHLLIEEHRRNGRISLVDFYARRAIRILPALVTFLLGMFIAERLGWVTLIPGDWTHALTFTMNYSAHPGWSMGHLWSLSVEEQFYLLWPALVVVLGVGRAVGVAAATVVLLPMLRVVLWTRVPSYRDNIDHTFETVADAIAIGCVLAGVRSTLDRLPLYRRVLRSPAFALMPLGILFINSLDRHPIAFLLFGETALNIAIAMVVDWCVRDQRGFAASVLASTPARFIGTRSYSLYLWQQPFLNHQLTALATSFPLNLVLASVGAILSYALIERPFLKLRSRFAR